MKTAAFVGVVLSVLVSFMRPGVFVKKDKLSDYGFFEGKLSGLTPAPNVIPYSLNTPLFSNYAEKLRFIKLPDGVKAEFNDSIAFNFPIGTTLIKNFYYPNDFRKPLKGRKILETRLLVHEENGWHAYPYIWNEEQTDAYYDPAGETKIVSYISAGGKKITTNYVIPNKNQCKGCHIRGDKMVPIGLTARQLHREYEFAVKKNQLQYLVDAGILKSIPDLKSIPKLAEFDNPATGDLNSRARAYLDANCAHCHSRKGPASTSGLFLEINETNPAHLGVNKAPVAAGRGAGDLQFDIKPGEPNNSILVFRMKTNDPAIAMPEIGREQVHKEGVALIEEWIRKNTFASNQ
jgi:uncharacterized repeat protein (TIGR03806 family)